jgi:hypothetical protein
MRARVCAPARAAALHVRSYVRVLLGSYRVLVGTHTVLRTPPSTQTSYVFLLSVVKDAVGHARQSGAPERTVCVA